MRKYLSLEEQRPSGHILAILSVNFLGVQINRGKTEKTLQKLDLPAEEIQPNQSMPEA